MNIDPGYLRIPLAILLASIVLSSLHIPKMFRNLALVLQGLWSAAELLSLEPLTGTCIVEK